MKNYLLKIHIIKVIGYLELDIWDLRVHWHNGAVLEPGLIYLDFIYYVDFIQAD